MEKTRTFDDLIEEVRKASDEISRLKDSLRLHRVSHPEQQPVKIESALSYWEETKREAEAQLRQFR